MFRMTATKQLLLATPVLCMSAHFLYGSCVQDECTYVSIYAAPQNDWAKEYSSASAVLLRSSSPIGGVLCDDGTTKQRDCDEFYDCDCVNHQALKKCDATDSCSALWDQVTKYSCTPSGSNCP